MTYKLHTPTLFSQGFHLERFPLPEIVLRQCREENWAALNDSFLTLTEPGGNLYTFLRRYHDFETIEFIISIRDANDPWEEDGIWHDDGSRVFAFSLSLTEGLVEGGRLGIRKKNSEETIFLTTPAAGAIILFLTGVHGYEHRIHRVEKGRRIIIAGWCS